MRMHRWGAAILVAGTVTLSGAAAFAAAPAGAGHPGGAGSAAGGVACAVMAPGSQGHAPVPLGKSGVRVHVAASRSGSWTRPTQRPTGFPGKGGAPSGAAAKGGAPWAAAKGGAPWAAANGGSRMGCFPGMLPMQSMLQAAAGYLGLPAQQITADLRSGESLNEVANSVSGKTPAGLQAALFTAIQAQFGKLVTAGKLSGAQEEKILSAIQARLPQLTARIGTAPSGPAPAGPSGSAAGASAASGTGA